MVSPQFIMGTTDVQGDHTSNKGQGQNGNLSLFDLRAQVPKNHTRMLLKPLSVH